MMGKRKNKNEFYCGDCGYVQKPIKENGMWETFSVNCQKCGSKNICIRVVKIED